MWEDNIKVHFKAKGCSAVHQMRLAQQSNQFLAITNAVMKLGFPRSQKFLNDFFRRVNWFKLGFSA